MIQAVQSITGTPSVLTKAPRMWGLSVTDLHDAYWRARGVQCVRRGERRPLQRGAELFLLVPADQLVLFDLAPIAERLRWHDALVTRLRMIDPDDPGYAEHIVTDSDGRVLRIERRYGHRRLTGGHIVLTSRRRLANTWMTSPNRREGWRRIRRSVPWARIDHGKVMGRAFGAGTLVDERQLLDELVAKWPSPDQSIEGIHAVEPGVWVLDGDRPAGDVLRVGPLWLGRDGAPPDRACLVGPLVLPDTVDVRDGNRARVRDIGAVELAPSKVEDAAPLSRQSTFYALTKRIFDITVSLSALCVLWPLMLVIALLIVMEDGRPILFAHNRRGRNNRRFRCWKFRTMHRNAEGLAKELAEYNVCDGPQVFIQDDPRVTRIGRALRNTSLDELPQLFNVIAGQMSLVGPRPSPEGENQYCPAWRDLRLSVRPGITGLWQIRRTRSAGEDFQEWIRYDIEYVQRATFRLDVRILLQTARMILLGRG
jgi:lipopolysaccharide/colanic/teichoic acid biosynthesis glycosyltransferase